MYIIAEIGINHNGDLKIAKKLIDIAKVAGCDAVKFQKRNPDVCVPEDQKKVVRETPWGQITYFNAGLGYPYYTPRNVQFNLPSDAFHSNFQFRFRMPHGSGTCCDWWFVDDVRLTKPGGSGNWTTPSFGANATLPNFRSTPGPYGVISLDWDAPANAVSWSVLDGSTKTPLHGFDGRTDTWADLTRCWWPTSPATSISISCLDTMHSVCWKSNREMAREPSVASRSTTFPTGIDSST